MLGKRKPKDSKRLDPHSTIAGMNFWKRLKNPPPILAFAFPEDPDAETDALDVLLQLPAVPNENSFVYSLKISLEGSKPEIWRRILVKSLNLDTLHQVIQICMGWEDAHLHEFDVKNTPVPPAGEGAIIDESAISISQLHAAKIKQIIYTYDFGDDWRHLIRIENAMPEQMGLAYPRCVDGEGSCPVEDCGGIERWLRLLDSLCYAQRERGPDIEDLLSWLGQNFKPASWNLEETNKQLQKAFHKRRRRKTGS
jgi:hypothetical protein